MTRTSVDLSDRNELAPLAKVVGRLLSAAEPHDCLVVGATARDLILHHLHDLPIVRYTEDVDVAIAVSSWNVFETIEKRLVAGGARRDAKVSHRFTIDERHVDVVPFGGVAKDGFIVFPKTESEMSVLGFDEAGKHAAEVILPAGVRVLVAEPPALLILKLIAWRDRHYTHPRHDSRDIKTLLESYSANWNLDRLHEDAADLVEHFAYTVETAGAALIGREAAAIAQPATREAVRAILETETAADAMLLASDMTGRVEQNLELLEALLYGFTNP